MGATELDITEIAALVDALELLAKCHTFSAEVFAQGKKPNRNRNPGAQTFRADA